MADPVEPPALPEEPALLLGAVLDLGRGRGRLLLAPELAGLADALTGLAERWEVVSTLRDGPDPGAPEPVERLTHVVLPRGCEVPVLPGRFQAAALAGSPDPGRLSQYARALAPLGRMAVLVPASDTAEAIDDAGLDLVAADARVAVAVRRA
jgi:hypothetical protein